MTRPQQIFEDGFRYGAEHGEATMRQAETTRPDMDWREVDFFTNGSVDGAAGDTWRMNRGREMRNAANDRTRAAKACDQQAQPLEERES